VNTLFGTNITTEEQMEEWLKTKRPGKSNGLVSFQNLDRGLLEMR